ncbi:MAG: DUF4340 domain-containing protein [Chthoniobacteraceae bacterium]
MKQKNTLILLVLAAGLFVFIRFYESKTLSTNEAADHRTRVFNIDTGAIEGISITNNGDKIDLRKKGPEWEMEAPVKDRADSMVVNQLLTAIDTLNVESSFDADGKGAGKATLSDLGLETSSVSMKLSGSDAPPEILFGKDAAVDGKMYVRLDGSKTVYVVNTDLKSQLQKKAGDFRDHKLLDMEARQVNKFDIKTQVGEIEMVKEGGAWSLDKPLKARGDGQKISDIIAQVINAHIDTFESDKNLSAYGLGEPRGTITLETGDSGQPAVLQLGQPLEKDTNRIYAKLSTRQSVYTMSAGMNGLLNLKPNDFRDKHLLQLNLDTVDRIHIESAGKPEIVLARKQEDWTLKSSGDAKANTDLVKKLVSDLLNQQVAAFVSDETSGLAKYGLDNPSLKVGFSAYASENTAESKAGDNRILTLAFGRVEGYVIYAHVEGEPYVVSVPKKILDSIPTDAVQWRDLAIFKLNPGDIKSIEIVRDDLTTAIEKTASGWKLVKGSGAVNAVNVQSLQGALATLRAVRWTGSSTEGLGFDKPSLVISFTTSGGQSGKLILGGATAQNMRNAKVSGMPGAFVVNKPDYDILNTDITEAAKPVAMPTDAGSATPAGVK